jgi:hypothetical protein
MAYASNEPRKRLTSSLAGGRIGYNCSHVYPHTNSNRLIFRLADNLKGADMLMYEIFKSLGLVTRFRPVARAIV